GKDPGNIVGLQQEKKYTLLLAQELCDQLRRVGFNASLTRTTDAFIPLPDRPEIARRRAADLFISVHWNELPRNRDMKGAQTFCLTPAGASSSNSGGRSLIGAWRSPGNRNDEKNMLLAYAVQKSLLGNVGVEDRGVRRARYWILRDATMPAILIEGGFMSNPVEAQRIYDAGYRRQMAHAIVEGIRAYQRQVE
ncbi:MAG TPA: N-acetylmuramoyl-L-alanine amidase, partial [Verrucomicrobiae bacterium]|nr:N-acetylmuramoyl-L-alanine amidase [Verrucomicrobiae bacterium]